MLGKLFQIETELENRINENTKFIVSSKINSLRQHRPSCEIDHFRFSDDEEENDMQILEDNLPKGMFERKANKLVYKKFPQEYFNEKLSTIQKITENLTLDDVLIESFKIYDLKQILKENNKDILVYSLSDSIESLDRWISFVSRYYKIGQIFYVGTIFNYYF